MFKASIQRGLQQASQHYGRGEATSKLQERHMDSMAWFFISSEPELLHLWGLRVTSVKCLGMAEMPSNI